MVSWSEIKTYGHHPKFHILCFDPLPEYDLKIIPNGEIVFFDKSGIHLKI